MAIYLLALVIQTAINVFLGQLLVWGLRLQLPSTFRLAAALLLGTLGSVGLFGLWVTSGKSVQLGLFIMGLWAWWFSWQEGYCSQQRPSFWATIPRLRSALFFVGLVVAWQLYFYFVFQQFTYGAEGFLRLVYEDVRFYALVGEQIAASGVESSLGNIARLDANWTMVVPYHYFELYFGQLIATVWHLNALKTHIFCTNAYSVALISYSCYVFVRHYCPKAGKGLLLFALLTPFCSGIELPLPLTQTGHSMFNLLEVNTFKYSFIFLAFLWACFLAVLGNRLFVFPLLLLPLFSYTLLPIVLFVGVFGGIVLFFWEWYHGQTTQWLRYPLVGLGGLLLFLLIFYQWLGPSQDYTFVHFDIAIWLERLLADGQTSVNIILGSPVYFWLDYLPYVLLGGFFVLLGKAKISRAPLLGLSFLLFCFFMGGVVTYSLLRVLTHEAFQAHSLGAAFVGNAGIILFTILLYKALRKHKALFVGAQLLLVGYNIFFVLNYNNRTYKPTTKDNVSLACIEELLPHIPPTPRIATLDNRKTRQEVYPYGAWITYFRQQTVLTSISPTLLTANNDKEPQVIDNVARAARKATPFYQFVEQQPKTLSVVEQQLAFLREYSIGLVLVAPTYQDTTGLLEQLSLIVACDAGHLYAFEK